MKKEVILRYRGLQSFLTQFIPSSCLFLSLLEICEEVRGIPIDIVDAILKCANLGYVSANGYVNDSLAILKLFTNREWCIEKFKPENEMQTLPNSYYVEKWESWNGATHFRVVGNDTLIDSKIVKSGKLTEIRRYRY